jgi:multisubunit Na+/H+ antiporter MnhE subunit
MPDLTGPLAGEPRERAVDLPWARRVGSGIIWWIVMMSFWVMLDDSIATDELLAGAGAAALAALLAELVTYQAASRLRLRIWWLVPALRLP